MLLSALKRLDKLQLHKYSYKVTLKMTHIGTYCNMRLASNKYVLQYCPKHSFSHRCYFSSNNLVPAFSKQRVLSWQGTILNRDIHLSSFCCSPDRDIKKMKENDRKRMKRLVIFLSTCFILWMAGIGLHILLLPSQVFGYDELAFLPTLLPWKDFINKILPTGEVEKIVIEAQTAYAHVYTQTGLKIFKLDIGLDDIESDINMLNMEKWLREEETNLNIHPHHRIPIEYR